MYKLVYTSNEKMIHHINEEVDLYYNTCLYAPNKFGKGLGSSKIISQTHLDNGGIIYKTENNIYIYVYINDDIVCKEEIHGMFGTLVTNKTKKRIFVDMDGVLADFTGGVKKLSPEIFEEYKYRHDEVPGLFAALDPIEGSIEAINTLNKHFDLCILSTPSWSNPSSLGEKVEWIQNLYGSGKTSPFYKKIILTHKKNLLIGDYLIDDRPYNGAKEFTGEFIHFGSKGFETWNEVLLYIINKEGIVL